MRGSSPRHDKPVGHPVPLNFKLKGKKIPCFSFNRISRIQAHTGVCHRNIPGFAVLIRFLLNATIHSSSRSRIVSFYSFYFRGSPSKDPGIKSVGKKFALFPAVLPHRNTDSEMKK